MSTAPPSRTSATKAPALNAIGALTQLDARQLWRSEAPASVREAWKRNDHAAAWKAWSEHLAKRKSHATPYPLAAGKKAPALAWGLTAGSAEAFADWLAEAPLAKGQAAVAASHRWLTDAVQREPDLVFALECVAWATAAADLATKLGADAWWSLVETLFRVAQEAASAAAPDADADPNDAEAVVVDQLLAGELPLLLSRLLPELRPLHELAAPAKTALSGGLERLTDGEGLLTSSLWIDASLHAASLLTACWTRCRGLGDSKPWNSDAQGHYEWLVRQTLRLADRHGRLAFAPAGLAGADPMIREALRIGGDACDEAAAGARLKGYRADDSFEAPETSNHSEWSEMGVLATGWRDKAPRIVVAHPSDSMRVEVHAGKQTLLSGDWPVEASINGTLVRSTDDWDCQCWHSDEDGDYLELALPLAGGARLERQFFLSRKDGVGFLAETLFSAKPDGARLELTTRLPLGAGIALCPEKETREAILTAGDDTVAGVVPLALAEWRDDPRGGELSAVEGGLLHTRQRQGRNIASYLWFDFSASRFEKQRTWRQLTVAESLKTVSPDVAIGYRVQAAKQQWFIYRSLEQLGNRTLMGQNLSSEMFVGKYNAPDGTVDEYFEIEGPEA
ncbi:hypothetical protein Pla108_21900 [Botrimarina colliarenosi]|uniref:Heparinase II/III-like protein n=1 Tax=Botrimarina colliarenosi TaxID=2528001 RepID=A0A5C6AFR0_9BACT|nr:hypothetical protein [Botrimarina colliarenosi]TWT98035.1 hypothetical protein Pla108_21900 [Botrimarina colliarenosi]